MKRISEIKREIKKFYKKNDIDHILTSLLSIPLKEIYKDEIIIDEKKEKEIISAFKKIKNGFPVPYITKKVSFYDLEIYVEEGVFIPRPETETLLIEVIEFLKKERFYPERILDLGTGSGCIALFLKKFFPDSEVFGIDINKKACK
ncbi:MAG: methyltransferase, partial [candidate division WOR-3 bacterium]